MQARAEAIERGSQTGTWSSGKWQGWQKLGVPLKSVWNGHTVTSTHTPLARLSPGAKQEVSGMGKIIPTYWEA